jgi:hypothetical protein
MMQTSRIADCKLLNLPRIHAESGDITAINNLEFIPFETKRVYYLYDVPNRADRGAHAHKELYVRIETPSNCIYIVDYIHTEISW